MDSIIFDLDGTLWDATNTIAHSWAKALKEHTDLSLDISRETLAPLLGKTLDEIAALLFPNESKERLAYLLEICCEQEHRDLRDQCAPLYDGLEQTLAQLSEKYRLFIVSNCQAGYIEVFLETSGLGDYFSGHLCPGDTGNAKAANIRQVIRTYHLQSPVYVGDTKGDEQATREAGIPFVYASYGLGSADAPDYTLQKFSDLLKLF